jgi:hypothetical protein
VSTLAVNTITNAAGGNTAQINGMTPTADSLQGFRNRLINSDMRIDQRYGGGAVSAATLATSGYIVDRFQFLASQSAKFSAQQNQGSVTPPTGFSNYLGLTVASAVSIGSSDYFLLRQAIEGFNSADLAWGTASAATVTVSFRVYSSLTGTFGGAFKNGAGNRSYPFTYSVPAANTWTTITITVAGDTSGTWATGNTTGIFVTWGLGVGSTLSGTAGAWAAGDFNSATGAVSVVGTSGATFYITGVQLEAGSVATPFERRPYGTELALCQRYYYQIGGDFSGNVSFQFFANGVIGSATNATVIQQFPVMMRGAPSFSATNPSNLRIGGTGYFTVTAVTLDIASPFNANINYTSSGMTAGQGCSVLQNATSLASLNFSAEL